MRSNSHRWLQCHKIQRSLSRVSCCSGSLLVSETNHKFYVTDIPFPRVVLGFELLIMPIILCNNKCKITVLIMILHCQLKLSISLSLHYAVWEWEWKCQKPFLVISTAKGANNFQWKTMAYCTLVPRPTLTGVWWRLKKRSTTDREISTILKSATRPDAVLADVVYVQSCCYAELFLRYYSTAILSVCPRDFSLRDRCDWKWHCVQFMFAGQHCTSVANFYSSCTTRECIMHNATRKVRSTADRYLATKSTARNHTKK